MCHFVGTPSVEYCSKRKFSHKDKLGLISNSQGTVEKSLFVVVKQPAKQVPYLVSPTLPSGCQAQDFEINIANKIK
jgi:hypothetical protein